MSQAEKFKQAIMSLTEGVAPLALGLRTPSEKKIEEGIVTLRFEDGSTLDFTEPKVIETKPEES